MTVMGVDKYASNAQLIEAAVRLRYLRKEWVTLDPTFGRGHFWKTWQPDALVAHDLDVALSPVGVSVDFTAMPYDDGAFPVVVFDPPYKLNGTPGFGATERGSELVRFDVAYGVHVATPWRERMELIQRGIAECARVLGDGYLLLKCQDQVTSGKVRWQTHYFMETAERCGLGLVDRLDYLSYRPQPDGTRQLTARRNTSTLLVFKRGHAWRP